MAENVFSTRTDLVSNPAGSTLFSASMVTQLHDFYPGFGIALVSSAAPVTNQGVLWLRVGADPFGGTENVALVAPDFDNQGKIVVELGDALGFGVHYLGAPVYSGLQVENSGSIFVLVKGGTATGIFTEDLGSTLVNSGLIAAKATIGGARGVDFDNGGTLLNAAGSRILVEGHDAVAVNFGRGNNPIFATGPQVVNDGLIEAASSDGQLASIGILMPHVNNERTEVVNRGTIRADIAVYADSPTELPSQFGSAAITNEVGGRIEGLVYLGLGDDKIVNRGVIDGVVLLDQGRDRFESQGGGEVLGYVDLGTENDVFLGGDKADAAIGGRDDDRLEGGGGNDLMLGGWGDDRLVGGLGNDGLFGEFGDDVIVTSGGDFVSGGSGDDRIELGDYAFELVDGGEGFDTLVLPEGARILDVGLALAQGGLSGIDAIALRGSQALVLRAADFSLLGDRAELRVEATASDRLYLVGAWTDMGARLVDGVSYRAYGLGEAIVLASGGTAFVTAEPPAGAVGLDPLAGGEPAPLPGDFPGVELTPAVTYGDHFRLYGALSIAADETWTSVNGGKVIAGGFSTTIKLVNDGTIVSETTSDDPGEVADMGVFQYNLQGFSMRPPQSAERIGALAVAPDYVESFVNRGEILATTKGDGYAGAVFMISRGYVYNDGSIRARAENGVAAGVVTADGGWDTDPGFVNTGLVSAAADLSAVGFFGLNNFWMNNSGRIEAIGGKQATAIYYSSGGGIVNNGEIVAETTGTGYKSNGILVYANMPTSVDNRGLISADIAISTTRPGSAQQPLLLTNSGTVDGAIEMNASWDKIWNSGTINGEIRFGAGNDQYDGSGGGFAERVLGGAGADRLIGGAGQDRFDGGADADDLTGGGGADIFIYSALSDSTEGARDRIRAFETGIDKIDLSALGAIQLSWSAQTDPADGSTWQLVTATGAGGTLSIRVDGNVSRSDFLDQDSGQTLSGGGGDDDLAGRNGNDTFFLQQGGTDAAAGRGGNDGFYFGPALDVMDLVDGGPGTDTLVIQGDYPNLTLVSTTNVEVLLVASGSDTRFGDRAGKDYDYHVASVDWNVAAGGTLTVIATGLHPAESLAFDGSAESDGSFRIFAGQGVDLLTGGAGSDGFFFGADNNLTGADRIVGGAGNDSVAMRGNYTVAFEAASVSGVEVLTFLSGHTNEYGGQVAASGFDYDVTMADGNVAPGGLLQVIGANLRADESLRFDGRAETDGSFRILSGAGDDTLLGGSGGDTLYGALGADQMDGGAGADTYLFRTASDSTASARDTIALGAGDRIDLSLIDAVDGGPASEAFTFIGAAAFGHAAGELRAFQSGAQWIVEGDVNGDGAADFVLAVNSDHALAVGDFIP